MTSSWSSWQQIVTWMHSVIPSNGRQIEESSLALFSEVCRYVKLMFAYTLLPLIHYLTAAYRGGGGVNAHHTIRSKTSMSVCGVIMHIVRIICGQLVNQPRFDFPVCQCTCFITGRPWIYPHVSSSPKVYLINKLLCPTVLWRRYVNPTYKLVSPMKEKSYIKVNESFVGIT